MLLYILSAVAVIAVGGVFTFWVMKQLDDDVPPKSKRRHTHHMPLHSH